MCGEEEDRQECISSDCVEVDTHRNVIFHASSSENQGSQLLVVQGFSGTHCCSSRSQDVTYPLKLSSTLGAVSGACPAGLGPQGLQGPLSRMWLPRRGPCHCIRL